MQIKNISLNEHPFFNINTFFKYYIKNEQKNILYL